MDESIEKNMKSVKKDPPKPGTLCIVYFPVGVDIYSPTGVNLYCKKSFGPLAIAYKTKNGWKMADVPSPLRGLLGKVGPAYWKKFSITGD